jgi:hypothetical protein
VKRNPFRSERDAFRLLTLVGGAALLVGAVALLLGDRVAAYIGFALLLFGLFHMVRWIAEAISAPEEVGRGDDAEGEPDAAEETPQRP